MLHNLDLAGRFFAEMALDAVVHGEIDSPCWKVTKDGGAETTVHAAEAIVLEDGLHGG